MKRLLILALVAFAGWNAWKYWPTLFAHTPAHEAVIENHSGTGLTRVRLTVDGQTFVKEELPASEQVVFPFRVGHDATFTLVWQWSDRMGESHWSGGMVPVGPMVRRYTMTVETDAGVVYRVQNKEAP